MLKAIRNLIQMKRKSNEFQLLSFSLADFSASIGLAACSVVAGGLGGFLVTRYPPMAAKIIPTIKGALT